MTDWNRVLKQNHDTCIHQFLKFQATKKWGWFQNNQSKKISKFWTLKKNKNFALVRMIARISWNLHWFFIHQKVSGPHSRRDDTTRTFLVDHGKIRYRMWWNNFRNFGQGTFKILQRRFCLPNFQTGFVQKSSFHGFYPVWNHRFRKKMMVSKGRRTNL